MELEYSDIATTDYGNILGREQFLDIEIHALWQGMNRISGPAYTVQLASGDNLMLHSAIYNAPKGSIIVVDGVDDLYAVAGGNVCAVAKKRGIRGFIIDGVIRDLEEITKMKFPVYAKGIFPVPGKKQHYAELGNSIVCGGVKVNSGDIVVADMEGIAILPKSSASQVYLEAKAKAEAESKMTLGDWEQNHQLKISNAVVQAKKA